MLEDLFRSAPSTGAVGLELEPTNGVIRQVRSPGPWAEPGRDEVGIAPQQQSVNVNVGPMTGMSLSLWLVTHDKKWSTLVAPNAQSAWLSPTGQAIAYTVDGALFVRAFRRS